MRHGIHESLKIALYGVQKVSELCERDEHGGFVVGLDFVVTAVCPDPDVAVEVFHPRGRRVAKPWLATGTDLIPGSPVLNPAAAAGRDDDPGRGVGEEEPAGCDQAFLAGEAPDQVGGLAGVVVGLEKMLGDHDRDRGSDVFCRHTT
jgi:hypothetical protein